MTTMQKVYLDAQKACGGNMTTMQKVYLDAQKACGLKVGDWVTFARKPVNGEAGWPSGSWVWPYSEEEIGRTGRITDINEFGIFVRFEFDGGARLNTPTLPYYVLEKTEKPAPPCPFKPFDKVLVRDRTEDYWVPDIFLYYTPVTRSYGCTRSIWTYCIPYEGNEDLAFTANTPEK